MQLPRVIKCLHFLVELFYCHSICNLETSDILQLLQGLIKCLLSSLDLLFNADELLCHAIPHELALIKCLIFIVFACQW